MGAAASLVIAALTGGLSRATLWTALVDSATASAMIFAIIIGAEIFGNFVTFAGLPDTLSDLVERASSPSATRRSTPRSASTGGSPG